LTLYRDPVIASNIRDSHFRIRDLMHLDSPVSLYLTVPASDVDRVKPLTRIMLNQIGRRLTESLSDVHDAPDYKHRLLLMLDEFATFGYMAFFESELAYLPGYGIRAFLIVQSLNQIDKYYGQNNSILDNCSIRITYGATDERTAERISKLTGQSTQVRRMANYAGSRLAPFLMHVMYSEQESPRPLLTPGEVLNLPDDDSLVMIGNRSPYYARKVRFYNDPRFATRAHHQGNEALPPSTADALRAECPPYAPCAWETLPSGNVSHETRSEKPPAETSSPTMQRDDTLAAAPVNEHTDWDLQTEAESRGAVGEHDVTDPQNLSDEDRETAMEKERERVQRLRQQRARSAALGREPSGLPL
jgi:type IV secretion system protein VirD4